MITVVNRRNAGPVKNGTVRVYIGRPAPLGNQFVIGRDGSRTEVISKYAQWLCNERVTDEAANAALEHLMNVAAEHDLELECWCAPLACHGDVLKKILDRRVAQVEGVRA